jgi:hypothetical protein
MNRLGAGSGQIGQQGVQHHHGKFGAPAIDLLFVPLPVEADDSLEVFRESQAKAPFAVQDVACLAAGVQIVHPACGTGRAIHERKESLPDLPETRMVEPGLLRIDLGTGAPLGREVSAFDGRFVLWIEVQDALAGLALDDRLARPDFVVSLRTQHDLASHAFLVTNFGKTGAAELHHAFVVA